MEETNMEHYRGEIEKVGHDFAFINGKVEKCNMCKKCDFETEPDEAWESCTIRKMRWLMSEYKPEPVLTQREKHFVEAINNGFIARNKNNNLCWYSAKPLRRIDVSIWKNNRRSFSISISQTEIFANNMFPFITWEDEEAWSVEELRKLKVKGGEADGDC